uniref:Uncharacterized protein n=1 Tax=Hyaloperonospora arabidopsidis (strain Emoy2) TaxID=559515 RepID=M4BZ80_HYAAE
MAAAARSDPREAATWRRNFMRATREKQDKPDLSGFEIRSAFAKCAKKGRDRHGLRNTTRKRKYIKKFKHSGCSLIGAARAIRLHITNLCDVGEKGNDKANRDKEITVDEGEYGDSEEELHEVIDLT